MKPAPPVIRNRVGIHWRLLRCRDVGGFNAIDAGLVKSSEAIAHAYPSRVPNLRVGTRIALGLFLAVSLVSAFRHAGQDPRDVGVRYAAGRPARPWGDPYQAHTMRRLVNQSGEARSDAKMALCAPPPLAAAL